MDQWKRFPSCLLVLLQLLLMIMAGKWWTTCIPKCWCCLRSQLPNFSFHLDLLVMWGRQRHQRWVLAEPIQPHVLASSLMDVQHRVCVWITIWSDCISLITCPVFEQTTYRCTFAEAKLPYVLAHISFKHIWRQSSTERERRADKFQTNPDPILDECWGFCCW